MLLLIAIAIGGFLWWRFRRNRLRGLPGTPPRGGAYEEHIPLTDGAEFEEHDAYRAGDDDAPAGRGGKGKERAREYTPKEEIFRVDDSDDEDTKTPRTGTR